MDPRLLQYYEAELQHLREMGAEFAAAFPKIARRLGMEGIEVADPYVERLLEGFAFLAARLHFRLDSQFPGFTQHLLEMVYPHFLAPTPSMAIFQLRPSLSEGELAGGVLVPRGTVLQSRLGKEDVNRCLYRTAHDVRLLPLEIVEAEYASYTRDLAVVHERGVRDVKASLRIRVRATAGLTLDRIALDSLTLHLRGVGETPMHLYEQLVGNAQGILIRPTSTRDAWAEVAPRSAIRRVGFGDDEALLPYGPRSFQGYRLLQEYFAFADRFMFVELGGLGAARRGKETELDIVVLLDRVDAALLNVVDASNFALYCTPAINLFPMSCDNVDLEGIRPDHHVIPDRTRPMDFEVYEITKVVGTGATVAEEQEFLPFYSIKEQTLTSGRRAFFTTRRAPRALAETQRRTGERTGYLGSEVYIALVDPEAAPHRSDLRQLAIDALCTNRDLPLTLTLGQGRSDFELTVSAPVEKVVCVAGPTPPRASFRDGEAAWRLISHLSLNYLSLVEDAGKGAAALREMLSLYAGRLDAAALKQIEGVKGIDSKAVIRRVSTPGPITFGRGLEIAVTFDDAAFRGSGVFLLGAVLDEFFSRHASINSFTETVIRTVDRGEIMRWPARSGRSRTL